MAETTFILEDLLDRLEEIAMAASQSRAIGVRDPEVARYARALEYGSVAGQRPWPAPGSRTTLAVDPETGAQIVVSVQAPRGFIRIQAPAFSADLIEKMRRSADWLDAAGIEAHLQAAIREAATAALARIRAAAPRDSGQLADALEVLPE
jgi:hypothetical protein